MADYYNGKAAKQYTTSSYSFQDILLHECFNRASTPTHPFLSGSQGQARPGAMSYIVGLNSGSSFDGVDAVLCKITIDQEDGHPTPPVFVDGLTVDWPPALASQVLKAFNNELTIFEMTRLNYAAGALYAEAALSLLTRNNLNPSDIDVIGYDGQTIYQEPPDRSLERAFVLSGSASLVDKWLHGGYPCGLFIAESGVVAALTDVDTVTQFRPVDHALGGSGAPPMQYLDFVLFRKEGRMVVTVNIGGIANVQLAGREREGMMTFDTGPGNVLIDHVVKARTGRACDEDGQLAAKGTVVKGLLGELLEHPFFERKPPRSAWRLDFGAEYAEKMLERYGEESTEDLLATMTRFTVLSITKSVVDFVVPRAKGLDRVVASGRGTRNLTLMKELGSELGKYGLKLVVSDEIGIPAAYKEAVKFATLAFASKRRLANNIPAAGGSSRFAVLGKLTWAPRRAENAGVVEGRDGKVLGITR